MGSYVAHHICNLNMEDFEQKAISMAEYPIEWWKRYVDDTCTKLKKAHAQSLTDYLNTINEDIQWTTDIEETHPEWQWIS